MESHIVLSAGSAASVTASVLTALAVLIPTAGLFAWAARKVGQPSVMGEIVAGIALGPSLLGLLPGDLPAVLFPAEVRPYLQVLAQLGLVLFMFGVGYHLDIGQLRRSGRQVTVVSLGSVALPFAMGSGLAVALQPWVDRSELKTTEGLGPALFLGAAMSITAFPVLARIITERGLAKGRVGTLALACAALEDLLAWCILAGVVVVVNSTGSGFLVRMALESAVFLLVMVFVVRPGLNRLLAPERRWGGNAHLTHVLLITGLLLSAWATHAIGLHTVFGAFVFGLAVPRRHIDAQTPEVPERIEQASLLLLPVFFTVTGLSVHVQGLGTQGVLMVVAVLLVACVSKFAGAAGAARLTGAPAREAATLGVLINTRGLTELVILNVGLALGVIDTRLFTAMVIMALVTTLMAGPLLTLIERGQDAATGPKQRDAGSRDPAHDRVTRP
ncbi:cation:proton antiporter [Streptomyces sp. NPDC001920]